MRKIIALAAFSLLFAAQSFATYNVVLRNGTQYVAQAKWTVNGAKARFRTTTGQLIEVNLSEIDEAKSEQMTKLGLGDAKLIDLQPNLPAVGAQQQKGPSLGSQIHLKKPTADAPRTSTAPTAPIYSGPMISDEVLQRFGRAYENVGIFEQKLTPTGANSFRVELTADSEDKVFNAISATSFLIVRNAGVTGTQVDMVELFMKTTTGGSSGRFQMTREDAAALDGKTISLQEYFVRKVLY
ncbi:MAG TPA: hypothetical protein VGR02_15395 [Thermoanaerobaculia bacterium]|nr:hypothetical protein [Thermoanaerobaculia bacterium]